METTSTESVHIKQITIPNFSASNLEDCIKSEFTLRSESFRSQWKLTVYPASGLEKASSIIDADVTFDLECLYSSTPHSYLNLVEIQAFVESRENYPSNVKKCYDPSLKNPTWKHNLISRITLKSCKFSTPDCLKFSLSFKVPEFIFENSVDGGAEIPADISRLSGKLEFCDAILMTSCENLVGVNSTLVKCRSRLFETCEEISHQDCSNILKDNNPCKNILSRIKSRSEIKANLLLKFEENASPKSPKPKKTSTKSSPYKTSRTPKKQTQSNLNQFFLTPSPARKGIVQTGPSSPQNAFLRSPLQRRIPESLNLIPNSSVLRELESEEMKKYPASVQSPPQEDTAKDEVRYFKVNMSASVVEAVVQWLYTGECSRLRELALPLLIASLRHGIPGLSKACQIQVGSVLTVDNLPGVLEICWKYGAEILREKAMQYAMDNHKILTASQDWENAMCANPKMMIEFTRRLSSIVPSS